MAWQLSNLRFRPSQILIGGFAGVILIGAVLLRLPISTSGKPVSFLDALFTSTSALCVTGLTAVDTAKTFSLFGKAVIVGLMQVGGLGIITLSTFFLSLVGRRASFVERDIIRDTLNPVPVRDLMSLLKSVLAMTLLIEGIGFVLLAVRFGQLFPLPAAIGHAVFHTVSAFCNAGFSSFSENLMGFRDDATVSLTVAGLIIFGGLGFVVVTEMRKRVLGTRLSFHSRATLAATAVLVLGGTLVFWMLEHQGCLKGLSVRSQALASFFQAVTPRTAGFNTVDIGQLKEATLSFTMMLMYIGGAAGSCAGGIKVTTFAVLVALLLSRFHGQDDVNISYRRVPEQTVTKSIILALAAILVLVAFTTVLLIVEAQGPNAKEGRGLFLTALFEATSAFGTVGLSMGITPTLTNAGKLLIIVLMFLGRLGPLTLALAIAPRQPIGAYRYAEDEVMVG